MDTPDDILREAEARLDAADRGLAEVHRELDVLIAELDELERDMDRIDVSMALGPWASIRAGLAPPLSVLAAALFFDVGAWPLGLVSTLTAAVQALLLPRLTRGGR
ncbi:MAG: hypothetical protein MUC96_14170 [Myxococcaceae bacterium]|jgi:hypothetical protein|nr:hypothetical protein [Myxococcaceae bacterium]